MTPTKMKNLNSRSCRHVRALLLHRGLPWMIMMALLLLLSSPLLVLAANCPSGQYGTGGSSCFDCPNKELAATAKVDYSGAATIAECGDFYSAGFWELAEVGPVSAGGGTVQWSLEKIYATSFRESAVAASIFSYGYEDWIVGATTYFETSDAGGWLDDVSDIGAIGGSIGVGVREMVTDIRSLDIVSLEVSQDATATISTAVQQVLLASSTIVCQQSCGYNPERPDDRTAFVFNWVEALYDAQSELTHFVRTCSSWCAYDSSTYHDIYTYIYILYRWPILSACQKLSAPCRRSPHLTQTSAHWNLFLIVLLCLSVCFR